MLESGNEAYRRASQLLVSTLFRTVGAIWLRFVACVHISEFLQIGQNLVPARGVLLCRDGSIEVGIESFDVVFHARRNGTFRPRNQLMQQISVSSICQGVATGLHDTARIQIAVGQWMTRIAHN